MVFKHNMRTAYAVASVHGVHAGSSAYGFQALEIMCIEPVQLQVCMVSMLVPQHGFHA